jgi:eukaryotic-like serine/threonine-protein kinase
VTTGTSTSAARTDCCACAQREALLARPTRVNASGYADLAVGRGERLVFVAGRAVSDPVDEAVWVTRAGDIAAVDPTWRFASASNSGWALSPDGNRLAIKLNTDRGQDIWVRDLRTHALQRLTFHEGNHFRPRWSSDGRWILFITRPGGSGTSHVYRQRADGTGRPELLLDLPQSILEARWSHDDRWLLARTGGATAAPGQRDIWIRAMSGDTTPRPLLAGPADERAFAVSPDGRWLAFASDASGANEVYVRPFPDVDGGIWQISVGGGSAPLWAHSSRELFYVNAASQLVVVDVSDGPVRAGDRRVLFSLAGFRLSTNYTWFDLHRDDQRFLMVREADAEPRLVVVDHLNTLVQTRLRQ